MRQISVRKSTKKMIFVSEFLIVLIILILEQLMKIVNANSNR